MAKTTARRSPARALQMDDEVQGMVDQLFRALAEKGYDFRIEVTYRKDGIGGRIIHIPMPKRDG